MTTIPIHDDHFSARQERGLLLQKSPGYTGIDYIEVDKGGPDSGVDWVLRVHFFGGGETTKGLTHHHIRLTTRTGSGTNLTVVPPVKPETGYLVVNLKETELSQNTLLPISGESSPGYYLKIVDLPFIDPFLSRAPFFLRSTTPLDPAARTPGSHLPLPVVPIDYLSKDYGSFRQLILDQLSLLVPNWQERHVPDLGITLVELLAYAGDYLSYYQDAVATEAYPGTARRRVSLVRHGRLKDYYPNPGCNSRVMVHVQVERFVELPKGTPLLSKIPGQGPLVSPRFYREQILYNDSKVRVFEVLTDIQLYPQHNMIMLYNWGIDDLSLKKGTTSAALDGWYPHLKQGDLLAFEQDPHKLHRLHLVRLAGEPLCGRDDICGRDITYIHWSEEDALPWDISLCSFDTGPRGVVYGNIVPADFGRTVATEELPPPAVGEKFYPRLSIPGIIYAAPYDPSLPAAHFFDQDPARALAAVELFHHEETALTADRQRAWTCRRDLLASDPFARDFVVEAEGEEARLRFGDGICGQKPVPGGRFRVSYRVGFGSDGHVRGNQIAHVVGDDLPITGVNNPRASSNYIPAESNRQVRINIPQAFKTQERCITAQDYAETALRHDNVREARAVLRWTGSWYTAFVYVDRRDGKPMDRFFKEEIGRFMEPFRPAGFDIEIVSPYYVPLVVTLTVYLEPGRSAKPVRQELARAFSNRKTANGDRGFFYPGNFGFGQPVYVSEVIDRAKQIKGIFRVQIDQCRRLDRDEDYPPGQYPMKIAIGPLEIISVKNEAHSPEDGAVYFNIIPAGPGGDGER